MKMTKLLVVFLTWTLLASMAYEECDAALFYYHVARQGKVVFLFVV